jgi:hypothetical protein
VFVQASESDLQYRKGTSLLLVNLSIFRKLRVRYFIVQAPSKQTKLKLSKGFWSFCSQLLQLLGDGKMKYHTLCYQNP